jgi:hypothetical protein
MLLVKDTSEGVQPYVTKWWGCKRKGLCYVAKKLRSNFSK